VWDDCTEAHGTCLPWRRRKNSSGLGNIKIIGFSDFKTAGAFRPKVINPLTCIASGPCLPGMRIFPADGMIAKPDLPHRFTEGKNFPLYDRLCRPDWFYIKKFTKNWFFGLQKGGKRAT
jgi:hypothetical protein